jgi:hypothetical protein
MSRRSVGRVVLVLLLAGALAAPAAWAAPVGPLKASPFDLLAQLWSSLVALWAEEGCGIDPNGGCATGAPPPSTDIGCGLDPNGGCTPGS